MKSIRFCLLAGLFSLCLFTSCKKDADDGGVVEIPEGIAVKIDGVDFAPTSTEGIDMGNVVWLNGSKSNGNTVLSLRLPIDAQPGTYTFPTSDPYTLSAYYTYLAGSTYGAKSGKIIVTKHDVAAQTIEGTFELVCQSISGTATVTMTEGTFNMSTNKGMPLRGNNWNTEDTDGTRIFSISINPYLIHVLCVTIALSTIKNQYLKTSK